MSLKAIEMQIALPRTQDVGKVQEQLLQRSQVSQDLAAKEMKKEVEKQEKTVIKQRQKGNVELKQEDGAPQRHQPMKQGKKEQEEEESSKTKHPYKGSAIDYSG